MSEIKGEISRRELLKMASPLGRVTLDKTRCTGCGLCVQECPTEALSVTVDKTGVGFSLIFKHSRCVPCNQCVAICPEKCLTLEHTVSTDKLKGPELLFEDNLVRCTECGRPVGPRALLNSVKAKIGATGHSVAANFELCPDCKATKFTGMKS
jgi:ferredoxin